MILSWVLSLVLVLFVFLAVGPAIGLVAVFALDLFPTEDMADLLLPSYFMGALPALLAGAVNWVLLLLFSRLKRVRLDWLNILLSSAISSSLFWITDGYTKTALLLSFSCVVATIVCVVLVNRAAWNLLEDV